ncbi:MAG: glucosamine-6-phosphate deaminase [Bacteroidetes bacterium]|nr:glucosamine-6-phosphate deaminase [Bacteroidota bacterium]
MVIEQHHDYASLSRSAAALVRDEITKKPDGLFGFATGSTPIGLYQQLIKYHQDGDLSFDQLTTVNLDEYIGLPENHPQSYAYFMHHHLFGHVNLPKDSIHFPKPSGDSSTFDGLIQRKGGIDVQILGLGSNGHIGFNEPGSPFNSRTRIVDLASSTIRDNARFFDQIEDVPRQAVTMGIHTIMSARKVLLIANGAEKSDAVYRCLKGPQTEDVPGSCLQSHPDLTVILDHNAASRLSANGHH